MPSDPQDKLALSNGEIDFLFGLQAAEIQAKVALADHEVHALRMRENLVREVERVSQARSSAFSGMMESRGVSPETHHVDIDKGIILPNDGGPAVMLLTEDDIDRARGGAVTCKMKGRDEDDHEDSQG